MAPLPQPADDDNGSQLNCDPCVFPRAAAIAAGAQFYFTGKKCARGHIAERYTVSKSCKLCFAEYKRENGKRLNAEWHQKNKDRRAEYDREKRRAKLDYYRSKGRERQKNKSAEYLEAVRRRDAAKISAMPKWADVDAIKSIYKKCALISEITGIKHHVDHIVPLRGKNVCGLHIPINLQIITASENMSKSNSFINGGA